MERGKQLRDHQNLHHPKNQKPHKVKKKSIKVTYISNPIMVKACSTSEFRALVQELTGKNSDVWSPDGTDTTIKVEESSRVLDHETPPAKMGHGNVDDETFFNGNYPLEYMDEGFSWREELESFAGFQPPCIFV